ncbi:MAG TPA: hypothetical protein VIM25_02075 [Candidatus Limnocylindrales bacterium]
MVTTPAPTAKPTAKPTAAPVPPPTGHKVVHKLHHPKKSHHHKPPTHGPHQHEQVVDKAQRGGHRTLRRLRRRHRSD